MVLDRQAPSQCSLTVLHTTSISLLSWQRQHTMWLGKTLQAEHSEESQRKAGLQRREAKPSRAVRGALGQAPKVCASREHRGAQEAGQRWPTDG